MNRSLRLLKDIAHQVANEAGLRSVPGFKDFAIDVVKEDDSAALVAAKTLVHFCSTQGRYNQNSLGILIGVKFLGEEFPGSSTQASKQKLLDLRAILDDGGGVDEILDWISIWYE